MKLTGLDFVLVAIALAGFFMAGLAMGQKHPWWSPTLLILISLGTLAQMIV